MKTTIIKYLLVCSCFSICSSLTAQVDPCLRSSKEATQKYDDGWYDEAIVLLKQSLKDCALTKNEKIKSHKLLMLCYLAIDKIEEAEQSAAAIMKMKPNYEADRVLDPVDVIALFEKYKPIEYVHVLFSGGLNSSIITAKKVYPILTSSSEKELSNYKSKLGYRFGFGIEYRLSRSFWIQTGLFSRNVSYTNTLTNIQNRNIYYSEDLSYLDVPVVTKYYYEKNRLQPFAQIGLQASFLTSALGELSRDDVVDIVNRKSQRNNFLLGYTLGVGVSYKIKNIKLQLGAHYLTSFNDLNKARSRYDNLDLVFKYYYLDNDFSMSNVQLNLGIAFNLAYKNVLSKNASK